MPDISPEKVQKLLTDSHLMDDDVAARGHELIKADALDLSKWGAALIGASGGIAAVLTGVGAWIEQTNVDLMIALLAVMGAVIIGTLMVAGWVVTNDVKMRARTQQARYAARTAVLDNYLEFADDLNAIEALRH